ncbi:MAG: acyl-CoA carboxylase subunit beta [archaeon]
MSSESKPRSEETEGSNSTVDSGNVTPQNRRTAARERLQSLVDPGSFCQLGADLTDDGGSHAVHDGPKQDGVVIGWGSIDGRTVWLFSQDYAIHGGSVSEVSARKICRVLDLALRNGNPVIGLHESVGASLNEGLLSVAAEAGVLSKCVNASGVIPQISIIMGPSVGIAAYQPVMADFTIMLEGSACLFLVGPDAVKESSGEEASLELLGGAAVHSQRSGIAHLLARTEEESFQIARRLLSYLPSNNLEDPPRISQRQDSQEDSSSLSSILPKDPDQEYDMLQIVRSVVDDEELFEIQPSWAANIITGFARLDGRSVGLVANQPKQLKGTLDSNACTKASRFVRFCDAFNIPLLTFVDCPGTLPSREEENNGIIKHASGLLCAYCEATVPKVTLIVRKAYGSGYLHFCSRHASDITLAWPSAIISVIGPRGAAKAMSGHEIDRLRGQENRIAELARQYVEKNTSPSTAVANGYVDNVIKPQETRDWLIKALESTLNKRVTKPAKKHGTFPL